MCKHVKIYNNEMIQFEPKKTPFFCITFHRPILVRLPQPHNLQQILQIPFQPKFRKIENFKISH